MYRLLIIELAFTSCLGSLIRQYLQSPCPHIFEYRYDQSGLLYGHIQVNCPDDTRIQINVEMSVGNSVEGYNGNLELEHSKEKVIDDVMRRRPLSYNIYFPVWSGIPPKITKIIVNGNLVCSGPKIAMGLVPILTTINLQHALKINVNPLTTTANTPQIPASSSNTQIDPNVANIIRDIDVRLINPGNAVQNFRPQLFVGNNKYNFSPVIPSSANNFQVPKNPFLNNIVPTSTGQDANNQNSSNLGSRVPSSNPFLNSRFSTPIPQTSQRDNEFPISTQNDQTNSFLPFDDICGKSEAANSLIISGTVVPRGAYPWLVAMFGVKNIGVEYRCSGTLISHKHVVTAAHCLKISGRTMRPMELLLVLGRLNIKKWIPTEGEKLTEPESIHIHPNYQASSSDADIAILTLREYIDFTKFIRPLCLWIGNDDLNLVIGYQGTVVGWGKDEYGNLMTEEPKQISLPIVSQEECLRSYATFREITSNRTFCAGFRNGTGPCNGDSGTGFLMQKDNRWYLKGVVSMSIFDPKRGCDLTNYVVFTDASKYANWLLSFIK